MASNYFVHVISYVDDNVYIGNGTEIWHFSHVQEGAWIGENCSIGHNVVIGKNVMIGLGVVAMIFTCSFIYGISTASTANKHKAEADQVEAAEQASHLKDAPKSYADDKNRQYEKPTKQRESGGNEKISRLHDDGHVEYARPVQ